MHNDEFKGFKNNVLSFFFELFNKYINSIIIQINFFFIFFNDKRFIYKVSNPLKKKFKNLQSVNQAKNSKSS